MGLVDITYVTGTFIAVSMLFMLVIFSLLSFAFVSWFQQRRRRALLSVIWAVVSGFAFYLVLVNGLMYEMK